MLVVKFTFLVAQFTFEKPKPAMVAGFRKKQDNFFTFQARIEINISSHPASKVTLNEPYYEETHLPTSTEVAY
ncbi:MAG: hypothetical protein JNL72_05325 [Flavipsychrobacter sp.]|nr:hypothetical protein [Flavipsychrobacter sp.]